MFFAYLIEEFPKAIVYAEWVYLLFLRCPLRITFAALITIHA